MTSCYLPKPRSLERRPNAYLERLMTFSKSSIGRCHSEEFLCDGDGAHLPIFLYPTSATTR
ncbi:hypothetical protein V1478_006679 [Vespula squamosa]|uniref:Uncharacterized protein n=1 Tax=Vespula squamosa TaxID=30214 RepID=A0ABD2B8M3_VESSQ